VTCSTAPGQIKDDSTAAVTSGGGGAKNAGAIDVQSIAGLTGHITGEATSSRAATVIVVCSLDVVDAWDKNIGVPLYNDGMGVEARLVFQAAGMIRASVSVISYIVRVRIERIPNRT